MRWLPAVLVVALLAAPFALRPPPAAPATRTVIVATPHGEQIRAEFGRAFAAAVKAETGEDVAVDWRTPGGTSEIVRLIDAQYAAAFAAGPGAALPAAAREGFSSDRIPDGLDAEAAALRRRARAAFLASDVGCGYDVLFGGGEFQHANLARKGYLVDAGLIAAHPDWFAPEVMPQRLSGEAVYDPQGRYYGACFAVFGVCSSRDRMAALGLPPPATWDDLADPRLAGGITFADPTKSGVVVTVVERILQQHMRRQVEARSGGGATAASPADLEAGWRSGWLLLKRMAGNARFVTDGASKAVRDVARGDAAAGFAIDFHALSEMDWSAQEARGEPRLAFAVPAGGTSVSADPIGLLRGAGDRDLAVRFIAFVMSPAGQRLWNYRTGAPGGPAYYQLRRMPVRRDVLGPADKALMTDPGQDPYAIAAAFTYVPAWTAAWYPFIAPHAKAVILDALPELQAAWRAILAAGGPAAVPEAMAAFAWIPCGRAEARAVLDAGDLAAATRRLPLLRGWTQAARERYAEARRLAEAGR